MLECMLMSYIFINPDHFAKPRLRKGRNWRFDRLQVD